MARVIVSIVIPTYNRRASLARLLDALVRQTFSSADFEVIVVDDGSTDDTAHFVRQQDVPYALRFVQASHAGPAAARNRGVAEASGPLILFLDDDVVPIPELIWEHVSTHASESRNVVIGPMSPPGNWPRPVWVRWEEEKLLSQYRAMRSGLWSCTARQFYTGNASLDRTRFLDAGGFDVRFQRAEDVDLAYRLEQRGARFTFSPRAEVLHYAWRSFKAWSRGAYQYGRYDVIMQRDKGHQTLDNATREFHDRRALNQVAVHVCVSHRWLVNVGVATCAGLASAFGQLGASKLAEHVLSAAFSVLYWQGVCDELGDKRALWSALGGSNPRHAAAKPVLP